MDQFVTTYRRDYLWPYIRAFGKKLVDPPVTTAGFNQKCTCRCYPPPPLLRSHDDISPTFDAAEQDWSRNGPMGALLDPKLYPPKVGKSPETSTMRQDQPNTFLKKLHEKYPFLHEILQTAPSADLFNSVNMDRLRSTYQVDYCKMEEYPPDGLLRTSGVGIGPCADAVRLPGDPYPPGTVTKSFKDAMQSTSHKRAQTVTGPGQGGTSGKAGGGGGGSFGGSGGGNGVSKWVPSNSEYQDGISKTGTIIIKEQLHYHTKKTR